MKTKLCIKCKEVKPISEFSKDKSRKDDYRYQCKKCCNQYSKQYRKNNKEYFKQWREDNKKYIKEYRKQWYKNKKEKTL